MKRNQRLVAIFLTVILAFCQPLTALATETTEPAGAVVFETEPAGETLSKDEAVDTEDVLTGETDEGLTANDEEASAEEALETVSGETDEKDLAEEEPEEEEEYLGEGRFPGLEAEVYDSIEGIDEDKEELSEHLDDVEESVPGVDYARDEIIVKAPDMETALLYAEAFGGELLYFEYGYALICLLPEAYGYDAAGTDPDDEWIVKEAVLASADPEVLLPAAWPNHYGRYADVDTKVVFGDFNALYNDSFLNETSESYQYQHYLLQTESAWRAGVTGSGIKVAVLDSGVYDSHNDLNVPKENRYFYDYRHVNPDQESPATVVLQPFPSPGDEDYDGKRAVCIDSNGHGTHCTGIIAAVKDNNDTDGYSVGVAPDATMYVANTDGRPENGERYPNEYATGNGIMKATKEWGVDVISISLSFKGYTPSIIDAIDGEDGAYKNGVAVFCSSGNDASNILSYPASCEHAIAVGAVDAGNVRAEFSNQNAKVRYSGPGVDVFSTYLDKEHPDDNNFYQALSGTSMATPAVAGVAALILSSGKVTKTGEQRVDQLLSIMDKCCVASGVGKGTPNLGKLFTTATMTTAPKAPVADKLSGIIKDENINVNIESEAGTDLYYTLDGSAIKYKDGKISDNAIKVDGNQETINIGGAAKVVLKMVALNPQNGLCSKEAIYTYQFRCNLSSVSLVIPGGVNKVFRGSAVILDLKYTPSYARKVKYAWKVTSYPVGANPAYVTVKGNKLSVSKFAFPGDYTIEAFPDGSNIPFGGMQITVEEPGNNPVTQFRAATTKLSVLKTKGAKVNLLVKLKDGTVVDAYDYTQWTSTDNSIANPHVDYTKKNELIVSTYKSGNVVLTGLAKDGSGKKCTINVTVLEPVEEISVEYANRPAKPGYVYLAPGKTIKPTKITVAPSNANNKKIKFSFMNPPEDCKGLKLNESTGAISAAATGVDASHSYTVEAEATDGSGKYFLFFVLIAAENTTFQEISAFQDITLSESAVKLFRKTNAAGAPTQKELTVSVKGGKSCDGDVKERLVITSSAPGIATAEISGDNPDALTLTVKATGNATGTATITVESDDGTNIKKTVKVTVANPVTKLYLSPQAGRTNVLQYGKTLKLTPTFVTAYGSVDVAAKKLKWTSERPDILTVNTSGLVKNMAKNGWDGKIKITAETTDGSNLKAEYEIIPNAQLSKIEGKFIQDDDGARIEIDDVTAAEGTNHVYCSYGFTIDGPAGGMYGVWDREYPWKLWIVTDKKSTPGKYKVTVYRTDGGTQKSAVIINLKQD